MQTGIFTTASCFARPALNLEQADYALLPPNRTGAMMLWKERGWQAVYFDDTAVVLVKNIKKFPRLAGSQTTVLARRKRQGRGRLP